MALVVSVGAMLSNAKIYSRQKEKYKAKLHLLVPSGCSMRTRKEAEMKLTFQVWWRKYFSFFLLWYARMIFENKIDMGCY